MYAETLELSRKEVILLKTLFSVDDILLALQRFYRGNYTVENKTMVELTKDAMDLFAKIDGFTE